MMIYYLDQGGFRIHFKVKITGGRFVIFGKGAREDLRVEEGRDEMRRKKGK